MRRLFALLGACALVAALAGPVAAADYQTPETFTVPSTLTLVVNSAAIDYGNVAKGTSSGWRDAGGIVTADVPWTLSVVGSDFTGTRDNLPASIREKAINAGGDGAAPWADGVFATGVEGEVSAPLFVRVDIPTNAKPGSYTGTLTFTLAAQ